MSRLWQIWLKIIDYISNTGQATVLEEKKMHHEYLNLSLLYFSVQTKKNVKRKWTRSHVWRLVCVQQVKRKNKDVAEIQICHMFQHTVNVLRNLKAISFTIRTERTWSTYFS